MKNRTLLIIGMGLLALMLLQGCATRPVDPADPEQVNVFAENVELLGESVDAVEKTLICDSNLAREWFFRPIGNALSLLPFFEGAGDIC